MIRLIVDAKVYEALKKVVKKTNKAKERLDVYVNNLEREINAKLFQPRNALMIKNKEYFASKTVISEGGGKITALQSIRTDKWLIDNDLALIEVMNAGKANNLTGEISKIRFTDLVTVKDDDGISLLERMDPVALDLHLKTVPANDIQIYANYINQFNKQSKKAVNEQYDLLQVNVQSVISYIKNIVAEKIGRKNISGKSRSELHKALFILRVAQINNSIFPQKKKKSLFGRTYYEGVSIQSAKKDLRYAILKGCYEYDVKSSVMAWKYSFAKQQMASEGKSGSQEDEFLAIYYYLTYKRDYFDELRTKVFSDTDDLSEEKMTKIIKQAMTALSFGAKLTERGWRDNFGKNEEGSIANIFGSQLAEEKKKFINAVEVRKFKEQQSMLDKFIVDEFCKKYQWLGKQSELKTRSGRRSNAKVLAWLYQHAETIMMDLVRDELEKIGVSVKANIHDAIVVDRKLSSSERTHIERVIRTITGVELFALGEKQY